MITVRFLETAQIELDEAVDYYRAEAPGLGDDFLIEILNAIGRIRQYPEAWQVFTKHTRRCRTRTFPYGVIYQTDGNGILIVAVAHLHRKPNYWADRIKP